MKSNLESRIGYQKVKQFSKNINEGRSQKNSSWLWNVSTILATRGIEPGNLCLQGVALPISLSQGIIYFNSFVISLIYFNQWEFNV